ncbi:hypothetical protein [Methylosinus sp. Sm6]|uniref:hypothetical protein n=1 Tax=Methylosinus sp. Sm6 TaxID=2866948 RepID=UPI001C99CE4B|nr:hypothetical protein [Methylosinus sp. Sm6]MBY6240057.1 hypothetical protein [Methylosinus sp. Sm6]
MQEAFEREKWESERDARASEIAIKEREVAVKEAEARRTLWQTPIGAAIIAAAIAATANAGAAAINGIYQRDLEDRKDEAALLLEAIKTNNDRKKARDNLEFLVRAGLITDEQRRMKLIDFVRSTNQESFPVLPAQQSVSIAQPPTGEWFTVSCVGVPHVDLHAYHEKLDQSRVPSALRRSISESKDELQIVFDLPGGPHGFTETIVIKNIDNGVNMAVLGSRIIGQFLGKPMSTAIKEYLHKAGVDESKCNVN